MRVFRIRQFVIFSFVISGLSAAASAASRETPVIPPSTVLQIATIFQQTSSNLLLLSTYAGAKPDDLQKISDDLRNHPSPLTSMHIEVRNSQLWVDGKRTDFRYLSYQPLRIQRGQTIWAESRESSLAGKYFSFQKLLLNQYTQKSSAKLQLILSPLWAQSIDEVVGDKIDAGVRTGAIAGFIVGAVAGGSGGPAGAVAVGAMASIPGMCAGALIGLLDGMYDAAFVKKNGAPRKELVDVILNQKFKLICSPEQIQLRTARANEFPRVEMESMNGAAIKAGPRLWDFNGRESSRDITGPQKEALTLLSRHCHSQIEADQIMAQLAAQAKMVKVAVASPSADSSPGKVSVPNSVPAAR